MFTGIVSGWAQITNISMQEGIVRLEISFPDKALGGVQVGASISMAGVCLTVVSFDGDKAQFDVIQETLERTTLGSKGVGSFVNYERAARFGDEIGGHLLSGHILGSAVVTQTVRGGANLELVLKVSEAIKPYIIEKGFVALDGVSLTIGKVFDRPGSGGFSVHLIPETCRVTTFWGVGTGDELNLEVDSTIQAVVETVRRLNMGGHLQLP